MKKIKTGYKASINRKCKDLTYEVGKTYTFNGKIEPCSTGFHYCKEIDDIFDYYVYDRNNTVIFEIQDLGTSINEDNKTVTNKIKIISIVNPNKYNNLFKYYKFDKNNNLIKVEKSDGSWEKSEFDKNNNKIKVETSDGYWEKSEYDKNNNLIKVENKLTKWNIIIE